MSLTPVKLRNAVDTSVSESRPSLNYADIPHLRLRTLAGSTAYSFVYFSRPFPLGAVIVDATLRVYNAPDAAWPSATRTLTVNRVAHKWTVSTMTWDNQPSVVTSDPTTVVKSGTVAAGEVFAVDVAAHLQKVSDGAAWYGWRLSLDDTTARYLDSAQGTVKPVLSVTYAIPPDAPTGLSPDGNRAVSLAKSVLRFGFSDKKATSSLTAVRVQLHTSDLGPVTWASPVFDSGTVATTVPQLDLAATAYGGLTDGTGIFWHVQVQDESGLWSDWSDTAHYQRHGKGTLTITNPTTVVQEATPPIIWTFTAAVQVHYQVTIEDLVGNVLHDSGKITGTATSYTIPAKVIHDTITYVVRVRVWDDASRENTPGDAAHVATTKQFTYTQSVSVAVVTAFTSTDLAPVPGVRLDWTATSAPDSYTIVRDGKVIDALVLPTTTITSGTSNTYSDFTASPRRSHTWQVRRVVNGVTSSGNPTVTRTITPTGVWVLDLATGIQVELLGDDPGSWDMPELGDNFDVRGASATVRITQAMQGYTGEVDGTIAAFGGNTLAQVEADLYSVKGRPGKQVRLVLADLNIPVIVWGIVPTPTPTPEIVRAVKLSFAQDGELPFAATL